MCFFSDEEEKMRILSLCPSNTEICSYLGVEEWLVGIDDYSDWPLSVQSLPRLGPDLSINMEKVEALKPDLVLASLSVPGMEKNVQELVRRNIPHIVLNPNSLQEIAENIMAVGKALGIEDIGKLKAQEFLEDMDRFKKVADGITHKKSIYWEWWPNPLFSPGKLNWLTEISSLAGGRNILDDIEMASVQIPPEEIIKKNPEYICLAWVGVPIHKIKKQVVFKRNGWDKIMAVNNGNIFIMEEPLFCRPSPRLLEGLKQLANLLHPEQFNSLT